MEKCSFIEKVVKEVRALDYVRGLALISDRAIVVRDNDNEFDVYFDKKSYKPHTDAIDSLRGTKNVDILLGMGCSPRPTTYQGALKTAEDWLTPLNESGVWYTEPVEIKLER